jgi:hypothetical protein
VPYAHRYGSDTSDLDDDEAVHMEGAQVVKATDVDLPLTVWELVSLLMLLEGNVPCKQLFQYEGQDSDATLPAQALQVCDVPLCLCSSGGNVPLVGCCQQCMVHGTML